MNELDSCISRLIKQIYRVLSYEYEMSLRLTGGKFLEDEDPDKPKIYSVPFLRELHQSPSENLGKILGRKAGESASSCHKSYNEEEKTAVLHFFLQMSDLRSQLLQSWICLQHYMHFVYRNFATDNPQLHADSISDHVANDLSYVIQSLTDVDETQLYIRIFALLRDYVRCAYWQYMHHNHDKQFYIIKLYNYYQSYLNASKILTPIFSRFDTIMRAQCKMSWMDFNKFTFYHYFFDTPGTQTKLKQCLQKGSVPQEVTKLCQQMHKHFKGSCVEWAKLDLKPTDTDKSMREEHDRLLSYTFWIPRTSSEKALQNMTRISAQIFMTIQERKPITESVLTRNGQCVCEDCLLVRLRSLLIGVTIPNDKRVCPCRFCYRAVEIDKYHEHSDMHLQLMPSDYRPGQAAKHLQQLHEYDLKLAERALERLGPTSIPPHIVEGVERLIQRRTVLAKPTGTMIRARSRDDKLRVKTERKERKRVPNPEDEFCSPDCRHEQELRQVLELRKLQSPCDHITHEPKCECTYCEVFGTSLHRSSDTRDRLRLRLNQRKQNNGELLEEKSATDANSKSDDASKTDSETNNSKGAVAKTNISKLLQNVTKSIDRNGKDEPSEDINDITGLVDYIEGNSGNDKVAMAQKKAAKKARQRQKKEEDKKRVEEEKKNLDHEKVNKQSKIATPKSDQENVHEDSSKNSKKNKSKENGKCPELLKESNTIEETIPAVVTIKRTPVNGKNHPSVTITLKGSTPDQEKFLYALVNNEAEMNKSNNKSSKKNKQKTPSPHSDNAPVVKLHVLTTGNPNLNKITPKELKVTLSLNKEENIKEAVKNKKPKPPEGLTNGELQFPLLRLPPGITITKVDGPVTNKNFKPPDENKDANSNGSASKNNAGIIVVDTETLGPSTEEKESLPNGRKNKKKKNKKNATVANDTTNKQSSSSSSMVTLKNPIFHSLSQKPVTDPNALPINIGESSCAQASIFRNENGMVTIRSSRLQQPFSNGIPIPNLLKELKPIMGEDSSNSTSESAVTSFNAQEILSGLPGIEITKVDKSTIKEDNDIKPCQPAHVSITPAPAINGDKNGSDKDDWHYDSVFTPKDILEDDMDADERELEAFKRFCQQSIPPKQKEKVAHLNVKDIILKKKHGNINT